VGLVGGAEAEGVGSNPCGIAMPKPAGVISTATDADLGTRYEGSAATPKMATTASAPAQARMRMNVGV